MEAGVVVDHHGNALHWHLPEGRSGGSLPDSRELWDVIWDNRTRISGIAHSHPGRGIPGPSHTDVTTFAAVEAALGCRLNWWITSEDHVVVCRWEGPDKLSYKPTRIAPEPGWVLPLREASHQITLANLTRVCKNVMVQNPDEVSDLKVGRTALEYLTRAVIQNIPHAEPHDVKKLIQELLPEK
jgi:hypothetical protein